MRRLRFDGEVVVSRLLASVAAAFLVAAATAHALAPHAVHASHPRNWVIAVACSLLGLRIIAYTRRNAVGWLILGIGMCGAVTVGADTWSTMYWWAWISTWSPWPAFALLPIAILIFPNGRPLSARWWPVLVPAVAGVLLPVVGIGWAAWASPATFWQDVLHGAARRGTPLLLVLTGFACFVASLVGAVASLFVRLRRAAGTQRRLLVWAAACTALMIPAFVFDTLGALWGAWVVLAAFPVAALIAILRFGLYDIDLLIHRTVLYGLLTVALTAVYTLVVLIATRPLPAQASVIGTVAVVVVLAPLHRLLRVRLDRWLYGHRADPYRALSQLGEQLANPLRPDEVFPAVAESVGTALKLPYVAIYLDTDGQPELLARYGRAHDWHPLRVPMTHGGVQVGQIVAENRSPEERFGRRERRLLADLARQAAPAAQSVRLMRDLDRINRQFEQEREEDLQRITRDLHDGIKPSLAGIRLKVDAARKLASDTPRIREHLDLVSVDLTSISSQVHELIRNIPPRELHLGLLEAVRWQAERFRSSLAVRVIADGTLRDLPAAVEMAAYRIVGEALANVSRHANACSCRIVIRRTDVLELTIVDDGDGIAPNAAPGIGLDSMRRRCEDLNGTFTITSLPQGTQITARLPLPPE
ncbi:MAG TPA: ATP-binding protein [Actinophytocola sp.]|uniref:sensor histidine kinase n=1 Tax=Actinophytocola sp. TaxID=1872138 RepID=UPI002DDCBC1B|nr:ATP-binding protein [Actinophytocola sp.]HEV2783664.1 ATP-binding protein [Actinophytocola sp.]